MEEPIFGLNGGDVLVEHFTRLTGLVLDDRFAGWL
jgi:hypothetical protein